MYLGRLPQYDPEGSNWREIRILRDYAVVGSEAIHHGVQIFDMKKLLTLDPASPTNFTQEDLTGHWDELPVGRTHNSKLFFVQLPCLVWMEWLTSSQQSWSTKNSTTQLLLAQWVVTKPSE